MDSTKVLVALKEGGGGGGLLLRGEVDFLWILVVSERTEIPLREPARRGIGLAPEVERLAVVLHLCHLHRIGVNQGGCDP